MSNNGNNTETSTRAWRCIANNVCPQCCRALITCHDGWALALGQRVPHREVICAMGHHTALLLVPVDDPVTDDEDSDPDEQMELHRRGYDPDRAQFVKEWLNK